MVLNPLGEVFRCWPHEFRLHNLWLMANKIWTLRGGVTSFQEPSLVVLFMWVALCTTSVPAQELCKARSLPISGTKDQLMSRIIEHQRKMKRPFQQS